MLLYPSQIINRKLPENYKEGELDFCKAERAYHTADAERLTFKNCYVNFSGNLYDSNYKLVEESIVAPSIFRNRGWFRYLKKVILRPKRPLDPNEKY